MGANLTICASQPVSGRTADPDGLQRACCARDGGADGGGVGGEHL